MSSFPGLRISIIQFNAAAGAVEANVRGIREAFFDAEECGIDLAVAPELSLTGTPLEGLTGDADFLTAAAAGLESLRQATVGRHAALLVGAPVAGAAGGGARDAAVVFRDGRLIHMVQGRRLINDDIAAGGTPPAEEGEDAIPFEINGVDIGVLIGDDVRTPLATARELASNGADLLVAIDASPFRPGILEDRVRGQAGGRTAETGLPLLYVNAVGGQDDLVFDGGSFLLDASGRRALQLPQWEECVMECNFPPEIGPQTPPDDAFPDPLESLWRGMVLGVADYVRKSGFSDVMLGLSGGMDSALVAAVAGDALGAERVHCFRLPSVHTSELSNRTAEEMCRRWNFSLDDLPIASVTTAAAETVAAVTPGGLKRLTLENLQARARGYLLMTLSNDRNWLLLSTGNKSEIAVGYATLYGDMCGGFNPLKDLFKTTVYDLARWRNRHRPAGLYGPVGIVIPPEIIERPPTAELAPGQRDSDSLPPYPVLDRILEELLEKRTRLGEIVRQGFDAATVERVARMVRRAEYKRRQGTPGPGLSLRPFCGRLPIANGFSEGVFDNSRGGMTGKDTSRHGN